MNVTIDLSEQNAAALEARAAHMPPESYLSKTLRERLTASFPATRLNSPQGNH